MPLTRLTIYVENTNELMEDYSKIEVWRSETKWGTYTQISTAGTRPCLAEDQYYYDFDDKTGSEQYWYKWRFRNDLGPTYSRYYGPIQGYTPNATYCTFEMVQRILGNGEISKKIRFSDSYKNLQAFRNNQGTASLSAITIGPDYSGIERFRITFSDATNFSMEVWENDKILTRTVGTGTISTDFVSPDGSIYINSDDWSGVPVAGDYFEFSTNSHMSITDAVKFIQDAEVMCDVIIESEVNYLTPKDTAIRFDRDTVPKAVRLACARLAAFFIYTTVYNEQAIPGIPTNLNDITEALRRDNDLSSWVKQARKYLDGWIRKYTMFFDPETGNANVTGPRWRNIQPFFEAAGVYGVGEGIKIPQNDQFRTTADLNYAGLLDLDLLRFHFLQAEGYEVVE